MNARERVQLWNWINEYVVTCGGDPSDTRYARTRREEAVVRVEGTVQEIVERLYREGFPPIVVKSDNLEPFRELLLWAENWLPDEAKDQGAREVLRSCKAALNPPADDSRG